MQDNKPSISLHPTQVQDLTTRVMLLCEMFSRRLSDLAMRTWVENLASLYGQHLFDALDSANRAARMPSLGDVIEDTLARRRRNTPQPHWAEEETTPEQQERDHEAARKFFAEMRQRFGEALPILEDSKPRMRVQRSALRRHR